MTFKQSDLPKVVGARVLVVEDESIIAKDIEMSLKALGYFICGTADTGEGAVEKATQLRPDAVLMDIRLRGEMDGIEAARRIRERMSVPVVFLTAYADEPTLRRAEATQPFGYVLKPFEDRELHVALVMALCRHRAQSEVERLVQERTRELQASERQFRFLTDNLPQIVWAANPDGSLDYFNARWYEFTGLERGYGRGEGWAAILHPDDLQASLDAWHRSVQTGEPYSAECRFKDRKTGGHRWFLARAMLLRDQQGQPLKWFGTCTDIQEQKEQAEKLAQSLRIREDFLAIAGHELKTPLAALLMQVQGLERAAKKEQGLPRLTERLGKAASAGLRLEKLVSELLDVSRFTAGRLKLEPEPVKLDELVREVLARFTEQASRVQSPVRLHVEADVTGLWDRARVDQVVTNLVSNALKYGKGKPVEVTVGAEAGHAVLRVRDYGIGIALDQQGIIFERFERAVATREYGGFGLGLWITQQIVQASGGHIEVESAPGQGATFTVRLPLKPEEGVHALQ